MNRMVFAVAVVFLSGCATVGPSLEKELKSAQGIGSKVECKAPCKQEWDRAEFWLTQHSKWKLQTISDVTLATYNPTDADPSYGFSVSKEPSSGNNSSAIRIDMACGNSFGCSPKESEVRKAFLYYVKTGDDLLQGVETGPAIQ